MKYPPSSWLPPGDAGLVVRNGDPTRARDVLEADRALTALACQRSPHPALIGAPWPADSTYHLEVLVPPFTTHVAIGVLAVGQGTLTVSNSFDDFDAQAAISGPPTTATGVSEDAKWVWLSAQKTVAEDGHARALEVNDEPQSVRYRFTFVLDGAGSFPLQIYALQVRPLPRRPEQVLPVA